MMRYIYATIKILLTICVCTLGYFWLNKYEYFIAFNDIDNLIGMIPVMFVLVSVVGTAFLLWTKNIKQKVSLMVMAAILVIASVGLLPLALRGNWWINPTTSNEAQDAPDLTIFEPFSVNSQTAKLNEKSLLQLTDHLPVLDGATALYPVYAAFAEATFDQSSYSPQGVLCTNTKGAYQSIISGESDIIFVATASQKQIETAKKAGADLWFTPIGREAFVFLVGKENPIDNLSYQQIRNIYSGKTAYWRTLGWDEGEKIIAFQRPEGSGSQTGLQGIMGALPIQVPQPLPDANLIRTNSLMKQVSVIWNSVQPAIGYSYRYYATTMYANPDVKLLSANGIAPTKENIQNGEYPFVGDFYAVTNGEPKGNTKLLIEWILSPQGQEIIEKTGYTPIAFHSTLEHRSFRSITG